MIMTDKERADFEKLSARQKELYSFYKQSHPDWSHNQIMMRLAIDGVLDDPNGPVNGLGGDVEPSAPVLKEILEQAKKFLKDNGIEIDDVIRALNRAIDFLSELIRRGVDYVKDLIRIIMNELFV